MMQEIPADDAVMSQPTLPPPPAPEPELNIFQVSVARAAHSLDMAWKIVFRA